MVANQLQLLPILKEMRLFRGMQDDQLLRVAEAIETVDLAADERLFSEDDLDDRFFVVTHGNLRVTIGPAGSKQVVYTLRPGDFLGAEQLLYGKWKAKTVTAGVPTQLFRIQEAVLLKLLTDIPKIKANLKDGLEIYRLVRSKLFRWLSEDELVFMIARKHGSRLLLSLITPIALGWISALLFVYMLTIQLASFRFVGLLISGGFVAAFLMWGLWEYIDWSNDYYVVTDRRVVWLEQVLWLYDSRREAPLRWVQGVDMKVDAWGRFFHYGDVIVRAFSVQLVFADIGEPEQVKAMIEQFWNRAKTYSVQAEKEAMEQSIRRVIRPPAPAPAAGAPAKPAAPAPKQSISLAARFSNLFVTRSVQGDTITYHKHPYVLVRKAWIPGVFFLGIVAVTIWMVWLQWANAIAYPPAIFIALLGLFVAFFPAFAMYYQYLDWSNDIYQITNDKLIDSEKKPFFGNEISKSGPLSSVLGVEHTRIGLLGVLLNFGDVIITVGGDKFIFRGIHDPAQAQQDIFERLYTLKRKQEDATAQKERERLAEWLAAYHRQVTPRQ